MTFFHNLKIRTKLISGFSFITMLLLVTGYIGYISSQQINVELESVFSTAMPRLDFLLEADRDLQQLLVAERSMIYADAKSEAFATLADDYEANLKQVKERMGKFAALTKSADEKALYAQFLTALQQWEPVSRQIVDGRKADTDEGLQRALDLSLGEAQNRFEKSRDYIDQLTEKVLLDAKNSANRAASTFNRGSTTILVTVAMAILFTILVTWLIVATINKPLKKMVGMIQEMAKGHLDKRLNLNSRDEIGVMAQTMDQFADSMLTDVVSPLQRLAQGDLTFTVRPADQRDSLRNAIKQLCSDLNGIFTQLLGAADQVNSGSSQVSSAAQSLSQGATQSAASMEQINSSMHEIGEQTNQSAENANLASQMANEARSVADNGSQQMEAMVLAMAEINESGQNISKIIKTIDEIAFQTNLLALNAAVEAARAGQHGKGFAVVAEEVRNLAARSAKAANETAELIEGSVKKAVNGTHIAERTSEALSEIVGSITKVTDLVSEIAAASNEQAQGISQVNIGLNQIDQVIQQTTANSEECAATSQELAGQSAHLRSMLGRFKLNQCGASVAAPRVAIAQTSMSPMRSNPSTNSQASRQRQALQAPRQPKSNDLIQWSDRYATAIPVVDMQHRRLCDLINQLFLSMKSGGDKKTLAKSVDALIDYTRTHFATEEDLMRKNGYPDFDAHKKLHDQFVAQAKSYREKIQKGERLTPADVFRFLKDWLINHIEKKDRDGYAPFLRDRGVAQPARKSQSGGGWGGAPSQEQDIVIKLDDSEFGRY